MQFSLLSNCRRATLIKFITIAWVDCFFGYFMLLKWSFQGLQRVSVCWWRQSRINFQALVESLSHSRAVKQLIKITSTFSLRSPSFIAITGEMESNYAFITFYGLNWKESPEKKSGKTSFGYRGRLSHRSSSVERQTERKFQSGILDAT